MNIFINAPTKSALKKAIKKGFVKVDQNLAATGTFLKGGEILTLNISVTTKSFKKLNLDLNILYQDEYLALIHKPPGILVSGNSFKTIANALEQNITPSIMADATLPKPIHRLDYGTTGVLLVGKTNESIRVLNKMFEDKQMSKIYYAIAIGKMKLKGTISDVVDDKKSITEYEVEDFEVSERFKFLNLVKLNPKTGRRHQIRKHLAGKGNPILGDLDYGIDPFILKGKGMYLHAFSLSFKHPFTQIEMNIESPLPKKFIKIFSKQI